MLIIQNQLSSKPSTLNLQYPPTEYMLSTGLLCPDNWTSTVDVVNNRVVCTNPDITVNNISTPLMKIKADRPTTCFNAGSSKVKSFDYITKWPPVDASATTTLLQSRCDWIKNCGPINNVNASWLALNNICSNL
jgi:hypothetical protein